VSAFGKKSAELAARIGDGFVSTKPDKELLATYDDAGGRGRPKLAQVKVCWARSEEEAADIAFERWPTSGISGQLSQDLPTPAHFEQAVSSLRKEDVVKSFALGPDPQRHVDAIQQYVDAGYDEVYVTQCGTDQQGFLDFYEREVLPAYSKGRQRRSA
jgi:G6PDH family F420-dependent oxidoreductase